MSRLFIVLLLFFVSSLYAESKVAIVTAPKSGTHLLKKLLKLLDEDQDYLVLHSDEFLHQEDYLEKYPRRILLIRDPRDVCISWVNYVDNGLTKKRKHFPQKLLDLPSEKKESWLQLSFQEKLLHVIRKSADKAWQEAKLDTSFVEYPILPYEDAVTLSRLDHTLVIKFENLVGPQGGGSTQAQKEEILKIIDFLQLDIPPQKLENTIANLFGGTDTFHQGQIGKWKKVFTRKHKKVFKKKRNDLLTIFGYEKDSKW